MKVPSVPFTPGRHPQGQFSSGQPVSGVLHRVYGTLNGDGFLGAQSIGINGRDTDGDGDKDPIGFHFLIGKNEGQWGQYYDTNTKCAHAKGANSWAVGIEFDGVNEGPLTGWQVRAGAWIIAHLAPKIPLTYYNGPRRQVTGWLNHASVPGSNHTDMVTHEDWNRMMALINPELTPIPNETPPKPRKKEDEQMVMMIAPDGSFWNVAGVWRFPLYIPVEDAMWSFNLQKNLGEPVRDCRDNPEYWKHIKRITKDASKVALLPGATP